MLYFPMDFGMMSDIDTLDVTLGGGNENPIERGLADAIEQSSVQGDYEANEYQRDNYRIFAQENESLRMINSCEVIPICL